MLHRYVNRATLLLCGVALVACFVIGARWPLVGDSVLMHYVVFLTRHGFAPYGQIAEMNLPLTYMSEGAAMAVFGTGDVGWRLYDGFLIVALVALCRHLLRGHGAAAGVFAATAFAAVHLQDGIHMAGQRDLLVAVLQAAAGLALLRTFVGEPVDDRHERTAASRRVSGMAVLSGALGTAAACIKPPALLFLLLAVGWRVWVERERRGVVLLATVAGAVLPLLLCLAYLQHFHATAAFLLDLHGLIAYHAGLERRPLLFLLGHAWSPVVPFAALAGVTAWLARRHLPPLSRAEWLAVCGIAAGLLSYLVQGKGFPYQRYPLLLWLLLLCAGRIFAVLRAPGLPKTLFVSANVTLLTGFVLIALFAARATRFSRDDPYAGLRNDLRQQQAAGLNGKVQCLDTAGPCIGALYGERLTQSTGFLYDCYLLDGGNPVVEQQRRLFEHEWVARPPAVVVLTDSNCFTRPRTFTKYTSWPWMQEQLATFSVLAERHPSTPLRLWSRTEQPYAYRILGRKPTAQ